jgi:ubiquinone/menaquinone biosynthesis C-methylase UbiE
MQLQEYDALEKVEREHWFYKGKRQLTRWWIEREATIGHGDTIVDAGAGTGELVRELRVRYEPQATVIGVEYSEEARRLARERKGTELLAGSILDLPLESGSSSVTIALDVLEHVAEDARAFSELFRVTKKGGIVIINVPAFQNLWSEWDVSLGHFRRYSKQMLRGTIASHQNEMDVLYFDYINAFAFLPIYLYRKAAKILNLQSRAEDHIPSPAVNEAMLQLFVEPAKLPWFHPPFGVSLFCVLRKK